MIYDVASITNGEAAIAVLGQPDFTTLNTGSSAELTTPMGLHYDDATAQLFVGDNQNHRVIIFDTASITNGEAAVAVIGQPNFDINFSTTVARDRLSNTIGVLYDGSNRRLYVTEYSLGNRIIIFDFVRLTTTSLANGTTNQDYNQSLTQTAAQGSVSYAVTSGTLPPGLSLSSGGQITGKPTSAGAYSFTVTVTDNNGIIGSFKDSRVLSMTVEKETVPTITNSETSTSTSTGAETNDSDSDLIPELINSTDNGSLPFQLTTTRGVKDTSKTHLILWAISTGVLTTSIFTWWIILVRRRHRIGYD